MTLADALAEIEALADPRAVEIWNRYGVHPRGCYYGVSLTNMKALAKKCKRNHDLAMQLWNTSVHDAMLLATYIAETKKVTDKQLSNQVNDIHTPDLAQKFVTNVVAGTPYAQALAAQWTQRQEEFVKQCGFLLIAELAKAKSIASDVFFEFFLSHISREVRTERNWVREAMNYALIGIGGRNEALLEKALHIAQQTGRIMVDYGDSSCSSPDAALVLQKKRLAAK